MDLHPRPPRHTPSVLLLTLITYSVGAVVGTRLAARAWKPVRDAELTREESINLMVTDFEDSSQAVDVPFCVTCGSRRRLCFVDGARSREACSCLRLKRRRLLFKQVDTFGCFDAAFDKYRPPANASVDRADAEGHLLFAQDE